MQLTCLIPKFHIHLPTDAAPQFLQYFKDNKNNIINNNNNNNNIKLSVNLVLYICSTNCNNRRACFQARRVQKTASGIKQNLLYIMACSLKLLLMLLKQQ